ncbi:L-lactate oxidase-like [Dermacentor albipictus]|uniref:L-lactate oxidase-like n=1 Tax=Dermacentor albipictus TaxID=60249 RepID=UPI0031FE001E
MLCRRRRCMVPTSMLQHTSNRDVVILLVALSLSQLSGVWARAVSEEVEGDYTAVTLADVQRLGEANLDNATRSYITSGAGQQQTLRENTAAFTRLRFRPKVLVDVSKVNTATTVLGRRISFPVGFSPSAAHKIADRLGELGTARAARDAGTLMIVSAMSTTSLEDIRASVPDGLLWLQTYIFSNRSLTESLVRRAERQGFAAVVVTADSPVTGQAASLGMNKFVLPEGLSFANLEASWPGKSFTFDPSSEHFVGNLLSPSATWDDLRWLRSISTLPIVVKGVLTAGEALMAYQNGASAIMVSNHGARQLDGDPATIEALPEVVAAVGDRMEVYLDSGVRSGADAVKALSIGARAVFVGRPVLWGLAYKGKEGVDKVLDILWSEFNRTIQLLGVPDAKNLCTDFVVREQYYSQALPRNCAPKHPWGDWVPYKVDV